MPLRRPHEVACVALAFALLLLPLREGSPAVPRLQAGVVVDVGPGAQLTRLAAAADDLYVIDAAPGHVRRYILHGLPYAELMTQVMRWKEGADKLIMGKPLDLYLSGERLLILDSLGSLWSYWGPDYSRTFLPLRLQSNQGAIVALARHGGDLLLLDPDTRQIWVYHSDASGGYDTTPRPLTPRPIADLRDATRLAVSHDALYVLLARGAVLALSWRHPRTIARLGLAGEATGVWASAARGGCLVSFARSFAVVNRDGTVRWRASLQGLGGDTIRDIALSPSGRLYLLTQTRIRLVQSMTPAL